MRVVRTLCLFFGSVVLLLAGLGCKDASLRACPKVTGIFEASYQRLEGSCQPMFQANTLTMESTTKDMVTKIENRLSNSITTEVTLKGCAVGLKQSVSEDGHTTSQIAGDLDVQTASSLSGMITRTEYMTDGSISCNGVYEATYTRQDVVLGAATERAQTAP